MNQDAERSSVQAFCISSLKREERSLIEFKEPIRRTSHNQIGYIPDGIIIEVTKRTVFLVATKVESMPLVSGTGYPNNSGAWPA